ncbi:MAG TPA: hypothetical protein VKM55_04870 [Candidatus Lokiarchaeia archaeon]|nr:hypothetical protein [Candidatus Lokiarchaeia archaeon]
MARPDDEWQHVQASEITGVEWKNGSLTKGVLKIDDEVWVEFDFKGYPKLQIFPKEARKRFPPITDLLPALVLWDDDDHPTWAEMLQDLKKKLEDTRKRTRSASGRPFIEQKFLEGLLEAARGGHPNESIFLLKEDVSGMLTQVWLPPGAQGGPTMAIFSPNRLPYDKTIAASFHSHPSGNGSPSGADLRMFINYKVNIIAYFPYGDHDFKAYDNKGRRVNLAVQE